ncbi:MAG: Hsp20 family protein, partial [Spirochaetes bacterium]|nr:Hsp20 family protein [Spirochaetota bacterium]
EVYTEFENIVYHRKFQLGRDIDTESVKAEGNNGVLTLVLLKSEESKSRNIDIN